MIILIRTLDLITARYVDFTQLTPKPPFYMASNIEQNSLALVSGDIDNLSYRSTNLDNYYTQYISPHQIIKCLSSLHSTTSEAIKILHSINNFSQIEYAMYEDDPDPAILNWTNSTADTSNLVNIQQFRELKKHLQQSILPEYDELKNIISSKILKTLLESYGLLSQEWQLLEDYFTNHTDISANDAQKIFFLTMFNSYKKFDDLLTYFEKTFKHFEQNSNDFHVFSKKFLFLLECQKKVGLEFIRGVLNHEYTDDDIPKKELFQVFSNIDYYPNIELEKEIESQLKFIMFMDEERLYNPVENISILSDHLYVLNLEYKMLKYFSSIKNTKNFREINDLYYVSDNDGIFSLRRIDADPTNVYSNEIIFRNFSSEFTSKTVMIFYEIDHQTQRKFYWIVSEAFNRPVSTSLQSIKTSELFSKLSNFKKYFSHFLSALEYLHSQQISGVAPKMGDSYTLLGASIYDLPFDLKYAKIGPDGLLDRIKIDYKILIFSMNFVAKYVDSKDPNELKCFIKEISENAYRNAYENGVTIETFDDPSISQVKCLYYSVKNRFFQFLELVRQ